MIRREGYRIICIFLIGFSRKFDIRPAHPIITRNYPIAARIHDIREGKLYIFIQFHTHSDPIGTNLIDLDDIRFWYIPILCDQECRIRDKCISIESFSEDKSSIPSELTRTCCHLCHSSRSRIETYFKILEWDIHARIS